MKLYRPFKRRVLGVPAMFFLPFLAAIGSTSAEGLINDLILGFLGQLTQGLDLGGVCGKRSLQPLYEWTYLPYATPPGYVPDPSFNQSDAYISGIATNKSVIFLTTPRRYAFVPSTLSTVPKIPSSNGSSPPLQPYPDISWHMINGNSTNCNRTLVSVSQAAIDKCNRLWVIDSGSAYSYKDKKTITICQPKIVVFDLTTNKTVKLATVPSSVLQPKSKLINLIIDDVVISSGNTKTTPSSNNTCDNVFIYLADTRDPAIISYGAKNNTFYRFTHPYMYLDPSVPYITIDGENTTNFNGIIGMDLGESENKRFLYFSTFNSYEVYRMPSEILQQPNNFADPSELPISPVFRKPGPGIALYMDKSSKCLLFNPITNGTIVGWSPQSQTQSVLATNRTLLKVAFSMTEDFENSQNVYIVDSRFSPLRKKPTKAMVNARILLLTRRN